MILFLWYYYCNTQLLIYISHILNFSDLIPTFHDTNQPLHDLIPYRYDTIQLNMILLWYYSPYLGIYFHISRDTIHCWMWSFSHLAVILFTTQYDIIQYPLWYLSDRTVIIFNAHHDIVPVHSWSQSSNIWMTIWYYSLTRIILFFDH
jgi:hypothetical protein